MTPRQTLVVAAILGLTGVAAGAFGAHALREAVSVRDLEIWNTGAHYQQMHAVALLGVAALARPNPSRLWAICAGLFAAGILVFSGTLYAMVLGGPRILGAVTPLGGLCLMGGWATLAAAALRGR